MPRARLGRAFRGAQRCLAACAVSGCVTACGAAPEAPVAVEGLSVIGGEASPDSQNAVVMISGPYTCTGSVVAPTLILTARHCLYDIYTEEGDLYVSCFDEGDSTPVLGAKNPAAFAVYLNKEKPLLEVARGVAIHSSKDLDLCKNDLALLEVDTPLPVEPLALRLDAPPSVGETGTLVGWGVTEAAADVEPDGAPPLPRARMQREVRVLGVGPGSFQPEDGPAQTLEAAAFAATEGMCIFDSGGPVLAGGAVFGVMNAIRNVDPSVAAAPDKLISVCVNGFSILHRLDLQEDWIREQFRRVGAAPWLEGRQRPAEAGKACELGDDCISGICFNAGASHFCSAPCDDEACPRGMECVGPSERRLCSLPEVESSAPADPGCAVAASPSSSPVGGLLVMVLGLGTLARRRLALLAAFSRRDSRAG